MTDRSSQPCSSNEPPNHSQKNNTKRFTVTLNRVSSRTPKQDGNSKKMATDKVGTDKVTSKGNKTAEKKQPIVTIQKINRKNSDSENTESKNTNNNADAQDKAPNLSVISEQISYPDTHKPAVIHALFDPNRQKINPARPLTDIPEPAPRQVADNEYLPHMFARLANDIANNNNNNNSNNTHNSDSVTNNSHYSTNSLDSRSDRLSGKAVPSLSKYELIQSPDLTEHLALLLAGELIKLPKSFYHNNSTQPLLTSITEMHLVDMSKILSTIEALSADNNLLLMRQGFVSKRQLMRKQSKHNKNKPSNAQTLAHLTSDEILNLQNMAMWEVILYPERFDSQYNNDNYPLSTDIMAVSVVKHALSQCPTRQSLNKTLTAKQITQYLRSYLLSQCNQLPHRQEHLKYIHIYPAHVILVAKMLGWQMQIIDEGTHKNEVIFNVSSRCGLFTRYPVLSNYYLNGWQ